jgi:hypothetical protein
MRISKIVVVDIISVVLIISFPLICVLGLIYDVPGSNTKMLFTKLLLLDMPPFSFSVLWILIKHRNSKLSIALTKLRGRTRLLIIFILTILFYALCKIAWIVILMIRGGR